MRWLHPKQLLGRLCSVAGHCLRCKLRADVGCGSVLWLTSDSCRWYHSSATLSVRSFGFWALFRVHRFFPEIFDYTSFSTLLSNFPKVFSQECHYSTSTDSLILTRRVELNVSNNLVDLLHHFWRELINDLQSRAVVDDLLGP